MTRPETGWVEANGVRLHYRAWAGPDQSAAARPLLLLHGLASASRIWDLVAPVLAQRRRVVALDQRGHGLSDKPNNGYDTATIVADDRAALTALGLSRPVVVGHSWGAGVALALAAGQPASVSGLALVDGGLMSFRDRPGWTWERVATELAPPNFAGTPRATYLGWLRSGGLDGVWRPELEEILLNIVELRADDTVGPRLSRDNHLRILRSMWEHSTTDGLDQIRCPVLAVLAEGRANDERAAEMLTRKRQGATRAAERLTGVASLAVHWLPDTVHDVPLHRPAELVALLDQLATMADD